MHRSTDAPQQDDERAAARERFKAYLKAQDEERRAAAEDRAQAERKIAREKFKAYLKSKEQSEPPTKQEKEEPVVKEKKEQKEQKTKPLKLGGLSHVARGAVLTRGAGAAEINRLYDGEESWFRGGRDSNSEVKAPGEGPSVDKSQGESCTPGSDGHNSAGWFSGRPEPAQIPNKWDGASSEVLIKGPGADMASH